MAILTKIGVKQHQTVLAATVPPKFIGWGSGNAALSPDDTGLATPIAQDRVEGVVTLQDTVFDDDTLRVVGTLTAEESITVREVGLFDSDEDGNMFIRDLLGAIQLNNNDSIEFTFNYQLTLP